MDSFPDGSVQASESFDTYLVQGCVCISFYLFKFGRKKGGRVFDWGRNKESLLTAVPDKAWSKFPEGSVEFKELCLFSLSVCLTEG